MSQSKFTASERADKCVLSLEQAIYQTTKRERGLVGAICSIYGLNYTRYPRKSIQTTTATHYHQTPSSTCLLTRKTSRSSWTLSAAPMAMLDVVRCWTTSLPWGKSLWT